MSTNANTHTIVVMHGDQTGEELLKEALRVLVPEVIGLELDFQHFDIGLEQRRATKNQVVKDAADAMCEGGSGNEGRHDHAARLERCGQPERPAAGIYQRDGHPAHGPAPAACAPGGRCPRPISIVRMAVDDAYGAKEWRETTPKGDEIAYRTSKISRKVSRCVAEFTFLQAERTHARVFGGPKYTVSPVYEGMFKEELDAAAARHPNVEYEPQLIDATLALLLKSDGEVLVIPTLNRDGDLLSDMVLQMFGSIAGSESQVIAFNDANQIKVVFTEAPHGTAPALEGKNLANPMAMILAGAAILSYIQAPQAEKASRAIYEFVYEAVHAGQTTTDLGGRLSTTEFTNEVIGRVGAKLEVWKGLRR